MQIITTKPLIEQFRAGTFKDEEVGPYFFAYMILDAVLLAFFNREATPWDVAGSIATIIITLFGILYLKKQNRGSFGNGFLNRYFALGWVLTIRMLLVSVPLAVVLFAVALIVGGERAYAPAGAIFVVAFGVVFYLWLGHAFAESQQQDLRKV